MALPDVESCDHVPLTVCGRFERNSEVNFKCLRKQRKFTRRAHRDIVKR